MASDYALGFAFYERNKWEGDTVVLILKKKPAWQAGKLNGVGGKVEEGELPSASMVREFKEETGIDTTRERWSSFGSIIVPGAQVYLYVARLRDEDMYSFNANASEELAQVLPLFTIGLHEPEDFIDNVPSLISIARLALDDPRISVKLNYKEKE